MGEYWSKPKTYVAVHENDWPRRMLKAAPLWLNPKGERVKTRARYDTGERYEGRYPGVKGFGIHNPSSPSYEDEVRDGMQEAGANTLLELESKPTPPTKDWTTQGYPNIVQKPDWELHYPEADERFGQHAELLRQRFARGMDGRIALCPDQYSEIVSPHVRMIAICPTVVRWWAPHEPEQGMFYEPPIVVANCLYDEYSIPS